MYSTCIFCHSSLGKNEAVERFPVGRRLAFDGAKGRLWVVCSKCGRWNLTPLEERWEAIEECEREYRGIKLHASTGEIGLGKLKEGLDLIRIGSPLRPEFASWRYVRRFHDRFVKLVAVSGGAVATGAGLVLLGAPLEPVIFTFCMVPIFAVSLVSGTRRAQSFLIDTMSKANGRNVNLVSVRIIPQNDEQGWGLRLYGYDVPVDITGADARHTAHIVMPAVNAFGGRRSTVERAVEELERVGSPENYFRHIVTYVRENHLTYAPIGALPAPMRLAAEMASQEQAERTALEGEIEQLENDWREAEEIAAIADNLFLPRAVTDFIEKYRQRS